MSDSENLQSGKINRARPKLLGFVDPLFAEQPKIIWNRMYQIKRAAFVEEYGLCNKGIPPRSLKLGLHINE